MAEHEPSAGRYVGQHVVRKEDPRLLTGQGRYVDDHVVPGMLHAAFVRSPHARAKIKGIDSAAARALPGVHAIYTGADIARLVKPARSLHWPPNLPYPVNLPLAHTDARFAGDPVVLVVADDRYIAEDAAELVVVDYEPEDPIVDYLQAHAGPRVHPDLESNLLMEGASPADPELERIFDTAPHIVERTITQQRYINSPMETRGIIASHSAADNLTTIWCASQGVHQTAYYLANALGCDIGDLRVIANDVGAGFGGKVHPLRDEVSVVIAARHLRRPIKYIEDRMEHLTASAQAREESAHVKMAFDKNGILLAAHFDYQNDSGAYPWLPTVAPLAINAFPGPYRLPKFGWRSRAWYTNTVGLGAYRGPWMFETVAREQLMDIAAKQMGIDPLELRRRNVILTSDQPYKTASGQVYDRVSPDQTLEKVAGMIDIAAFRKEQAEARKQGRYLGLGFSVYMEPTVNAIGGIRTTFQAETRIDASGRVTVSSHIGNPGNSLETTLAQIAADQLGVDIKDVRVVYGDTANTQFGPGAGGSKQAVGAGGAVTVAAQTLRTKILAIGAKMLEAAPEDLTIENGKVFVKGVPQVSLTLKKIAEATYYTPKLLPEGMEAGLAASHRMTLPVTHWANAAHACTVDVDIETGMVRILRWIASEDCGVMINPTVVEGQMSGGIVQGIGGVLLEHALYDERGNPLAASYKDYLLPLATDIPMIEYSHVCTPSNTPGGFKGAGEGGAIIAPSTLINAIADALAPFNIDCTRLPLSPDRLVMALEASQHKPYSI
jgi:carbon-monoxide dehydrogenase large subunit